LWGLFAFAPLPDEHKLQSTPVTIESVAGCVALKWEFDPVTKTAKDCVEGTDPASLAKTIGLRSGDVITAIDNQPVGGWDVLTERIRSAGGKTITLTYTRDGKSYTASGALPVAQRIKQDVMKDPTKTAEQITPSDLENIGILGITPQIPRTVVGPVAAFGRAKDQAGAMFSGTFTALGKFPEKVPKLWHALSGSARDPETPVSVVGASRIGGELFKAGEWPSFLLLLAGLNFFVGIFNLFPLLPLDGGHIAIAWFERARSWLYARLHRPDPGRVDYMKLMPITYVVILVFGGFTLLTVAADIVNPITLF
jgi:membrane-associated protease RseP (regulator of RpoE activity)